MDENVQLARAYAQQGDNAMMVAGEARATMATAGLSARAAAETAWREAVATAHACFAASMAHSNLTLMAGYEPIGDEFVLAPEAEKALDADG
jgi:hypothetical protein